MKTTSFLISKQLKEAGFGKSSAFAHFKSKCGGGGIFYVWEGIKGGYEKEFFSTTSKRYLTLCLILLHENTKAKRTAKLKNLKKY